MTILQILGLISGLGSMVNAFRPAPAPAPMPAMPPTLTWEQALPRAEAAMNPLYDEYLDKALAAKGNELIRRGFYGQLPGDALLQSTTADVQRGRVGAIAGLANELVGQSEQNALERLRLATQWGLGQGQLAQTGQQYQTGNLMNMMDVWRTFQQMFPYFGTGAPKPLSLTLTGGSPGY